jgi:small subunit ribosomal protein S2
MTKLPELLDLLKSGVHFGHQSSRWHPKMEKYIFGARNGVHIIDLEKTQEQLTQADAFIKKIVGNGGAILFLGTKKQVKESLKKAADECRAYYLNERWIGGFLTNFGQVSKLVKKYNSLVKQRDSGELSKYTKKEQVDFEKEIKKLGDIVYGVKDMEKLPDVIFVWDVKSEKTAINEAKVKNIPIIGICDTNTNPEGIDYVIPANDDASKGIDILLKFIAESVNNARGSQKPETEPAKDNKDTKNK